MSKETMKLALDALTATMSTHGFREHIEEAQDKAIKALEEALANQEQGEPLKIVQYNCTCGKTMKFESEHGIVAQQRTWVGLTLEDQKLLAESASSNNWNDFQMMDFIEAKLKEKNT